MALQADSAAAELRQAEAQVVIAKLNLGYTEVRAPFDGRIGRHLVNPGNLVGDPGPADGAGRKSSKIDPLYVYFTINERDLLRIIERNKTSSWHEPEDRRSPGLLRAVQRDRLSASGRLDFAAITVAPTTGTLQLRGIFPNPTLTVLPGLFVRVRVHAARTAQRTADPRRCASASISRANMCWSSMTKTSSSAGA